MKATTKSQHIPQRAKQQAESISNMEKPTKTQSPQNPNSKLPSKSKGDKQKIISLSRKIYIATENDDQVIESMPTAKHTFMSEQVQMNGERQFDGFYTPRKKDGKKQDRDKEKEKFGIEPDIKTELPNYSKATQKNKTQRSRFYYKAEQYQKLEKVEIRPKEKSANEANVQPQTIKPQGVKPQSLRQGEQKSVQNNLNQKKVNEQGLKKISTNGEQVKGQEIKAQILKDSVKESVKLSLKDSQQTPKSNTKMLSSYISKINKQQRSYMPPSQQKTQGSLFKKKQQTANAQDSDTQQYRQQPQSSRFSNRRSGSPLQQSHKKLFNKCYKQTYAHLKLMLRQIHESQQQMYIVHKEITDTIFDIIKQRAQAIRKQMNELVENIAAQWMKDEWEFIKSNEIIFMDDVLELEQQLYERELQVQTLFDQLVKENHEPQHNDERDEIYATFNGKSIRNSIKNNRAQTTWKKVTTDLLMFNYESNIIQIQELIDKISKNSFEKCNKAIDILPSSELFANNSHEQILNPKAKKWFQIAVLDFMNSSMTQNDRNQKKSRHKSSRSPRKTYNQRSPKSDYKNQQQLKISQRTYPDPYLNKKNQQAPQNITSHRTYQQQSPTLKYHEQRLASHRVHPQNSSPSHYPLPSTQFQPQNIIDKAYQDQKSQKSIGKKLYLDPTYFVSGQVHS